MNEAELAEKFNLELDAVMAGADPAFTPDPGAMALAAAFARADFSGDSLIKESLRERIAARPGLFETLRGLLASGYARAAFAAAILVIALLPLARRPAPERALPSVQPIPAGLAARPIIPETLPGQARPVESVFASLPMPALRSEPIKDFPIASAGRMRIALAEGREVDLEGGSGIVWEVEGASFILEKRAVAPGDLFEVRTL